MEPMNQGVFTPEELAKKKAMAEQTRAKLQSWDAELAADQEANRPVAAYGQLPPAGTPGLNPNATPEEKEALAKALGPQQTMQAAGLIKSDGTSALPDNTKPVEEKVETPAPVDPSQKKKDIVDQSRKAKKEIGKKDTVGLGEETGAALESAKNEDNLPSIQRDIEWLDKEYKRLNAEFEDKKGTLAWREIAETMANAVTQLFAAREGLRSGVDMSGLRFDKTDWEKKLAAVSGEIGERRNQVDTLYNKTVELKKTAAEEARDKRDAKLAQEKFDEQKRATGASEELAKRRLAADIAKMEAEAQQSPALKSLPTSQQNKWAGLASAHAATQELIAKLPGIKTGTLESQIQQVERFLNVDNPQRTTYAADLIQLMQERRMAITGMAANNTEMKETLKSMPTLGDKPETVLAFLKNFQNTLKRGHDGIISGAKANRQYTPEMQAEYDRIYSAPAATPTRSAEKQARIDALAAGGK